MSTTVKAVITKTKMKSSLPVLATRLSMFYTIRLFKSNEKADIEKVLIIIVSEANDQSRITSFTCVSKINSIEEMMPLLSSLQRIYILSDRCSSQFRFCFTFKLLTHLHPDKNMEWGYNEAHHGKGLMDEIGGTIKNKV